MDDLVLAMLGVTLAFNLVTVVVIVLINRSIIELERLLK